VPARLEEGPEELLALGGREPLRPEEGEVQRAIRGAVRGVVLDLPEQHGRQVDGHVDARVILEQCGHPVVVAQRVEPDPGEAVRPAPPLATKILVEGLMLVPEQGEIDLWTDPKGEFTAGNLAGRGRAAHGVLDLVAILEGTEGDLPVAFCAAIVSPPAFYPTALLGSVGVADANLHPDGLTGLDGPGADLDPHRFARARVSRQSGRVGRKMPDLHWEQLLESGGARGPEALPPRGDAGLARTTAAERAA
jgi:hypothetical protein